MKLIWPTFIGGIGLLICSMVINLFFQSPPTRAEFNTLQTNQTHILESLDRIESAQIKLIDYLLK